MFMTPYPLRTGDPEREQAKAEIKGNPESDAYAFLTALVQQVAAAGRFRQPNPNVQLIAQTLWAGLHGVISLEIALGCDKEWTDWQSIEARTEAMLDAMMFGLFAPTSQAPSAPSYPKEAH